MALGKAIQFIQRAGSDNEFRKACNKSNSKQELLESLDFNEYEFEDAVNMQLVKCQTYEEADLVYQIKYWFALL